MNEQNLSHFIRAVAAELRRDQVDVASQWVTGSIDTQEASAPLSASVADLVLTSPEFGPLVVEFKRGVRSSLDLASITKHLQVIRDETPLAKYALVTLEPVPDEARKILASRDITFVEGGDARAVARGLEALVTGRPDPQDQ